MSASLAQTLGAELDRLGDGALRERPFGLRLWDGSELPARASFGNGRAPATLIVRSPRALAYVLREPNQLGLGRAWVSGELDLDGDVEQVLAACTRFADVAVGAGDRRRALRLARRLGIPLLRRPPLPAAEARVSGRRHSVRRDAEAIRHHYDVPTDFYRLVLGPTLVYSCAVFASPQDTLDQAQERKLDRICRKLALEPGERLLDVGCGWGSLVLHAARHYGVRAVGVTLSPSQAAEAHRRIAAAGLEDRCEVRVCDYREVADGPYDKLASVGMYEHVGRAQLPRYVDRLYELVRPGGLVLNHGITRLRPAAASDETFIARYVFPDGELHPLSAYIAEAERRGLEVRDVEALREHYALTLRAWSRNLAAARAEAIAAADEQRERVWRLYMAGAALAFDRGEIGIFQTVAARPGAAHGLPLSRARWMAPPGEAAARDASERRPAARVRERPSDSRPAKRH